MADPDSPDPRIALPDQPIVRAMEPLVRFLHVEAAGGIALLVATLVALIAANSGVAETFAAIWKTRLSVGLGGFSMDHSLKHWISDGLMAIFFFVIGLEVKRELVVGELRDLRRAMLPIFAALGGMIVPAALYLALQAGQPAARGWGIPMATDIAFVVGCMALLGPRIPRALRVLLLSLAIADDIGAILVIAVGYTDSLDLVSLAWGVAGIGAIALFERLGVRSVGFYAVLGGIVWFFFHESGVHATIAGVILGLQTPIDAWISRDFLSRTVHRAADILRGGPLDAATLARIEVTAREAIGPLARVEAALHPWVSFVIMPLFALANAGVVLSLAALSDGVAVAVMVGLFVGKPLGIVVTSWLAVRLGIASLPEGVSWRVLAGAGFLAGIGFTMALFIAGLALEGAALDAAKVGILFASLASGLVGFVLLWLLLEPPRETA
jgi:Na+:H+ antiporter, NhaA family